jgi:hypothetical protein
MPVVLERAGGVWDGRAAYGTTPPHPRGGVGQGWHEGWVLDAARRAVYGTTPPRPRGGVGRGWHEGRVLELLAGFQRAARVCARTCLAVRAVTGPLLNHDERDCGPERGAGGGTRGVGGLAREHEVPGGLSRT